MSGRIVNALLVSLSCVACASQPMPSAEVSSNLRTEKDPVDVTKPRGAGVVLAEHHFGFFSAPLVFQDLGNGKTFRIKERFVYTDPAGGEWIAPEGSIVDGASIPQAAYIIVGTPLGGKYLSASVIHDVACVQRSKPWELVHLTFYNAMRAAGMDDAKAKLMYAAVYHFGPRWYANGEDIPRFFDGGKYRAVRNFIKNASENPRLASNLSLRGIQDIDVATFAEAQSALGNESPGPMVLPEVQNASRSLSH